MHINMTLQPSLPNCMILVFMVGVSMEAFKDKIQAQIRIIQENGALVSSQYLWSPQQHSAYFCVIESNLIQL